LISAYSPVFLGKNFLNKSGFSPPMADSNHMITPEEFLAYQDLVAKRDAKKRYSSIENICRTAVVAGVGTVLIGALWPGLYLVGGAAAAYVLYDQIKDRKAYKRLDEQVAELRNTLEGRIQ
jgi:hypothetical protein